MYIGLTHQILVSLGVDTEADWDMTHIDVPELPDINGVDQKSILKLLYMLGNLYGKQYVKTLEDWANMVWFTPWRNSITMYSL